MPHRVLLAALTAAVCAAGSAVAGPPASAQRGVVTPASGVSAPTTSLGRTGPIRPCSACTDAWCGGCEGSAGGCTDGGGACRSGGGSACRGSACRSGEQSEGKFWAANRRLREFGRQFRTDLRMWCDGTRREKALEHPQCPPYHHPTFGYHPTCWRQFPEGALPRCPPIGPARGSYGAHAGPGYAPPPPAPRARPAAIPAPLPVPRDEPARREGVEEGVEEEKPTAEEAADPPAAPAPGLPTLDDPTPTLDPDAEEPSVPAGDGLADPPGDDFAVRRVPTLLPPARPGRAGL